MTDESDGPVAQDEVRIRRAPRYGRFVGVGAVLGALAALVCTSVFPVDPLVGFGATFGYLVLYGIPIGVVLGALVAVLLDRAASRRSGTVIAGKMTVQAHPGEQVPEAMKASALDAGAPDPESLDYGSSDSGEQPRSDAGQS